MKQFNGVSPISGEDLSALPVKTIGPAVEFYRTALGLTVVSQDVERATVQRDNAQLGLVVKPDHNPGEAGSCAFGMTDLDAMYRELSGRGLDLGGIDTQEWGGVGRRTGCSSCAKPKTGAVTVSANRRRKGERLQAPPRITLRSLPERYPVWWESAGRAPSWLTSD